MPSNKTSGGQQPEALATFAATARADGRKPDSVGIHATPETAPVPTRSVDKDDAAKKVLREGALKRGQGARKAVDKLPDRIMKGV